jgi:hypothetical protein
MCIWSRWLVENIAYRRDKGIYHCLSLVPVVLVHGDPSLNQFENGEADVLHMLG